MKSPSSPAFSCSCYGVALTNLIPSNSGRGIPSMFAPRIEGLHCGCYWGVSKFHGYHSLFEVELLAELMFFELMLALYVAFAIGTGDESVAPLAGSGYVSLNGAVVIGGVAAFLGAVLLGYRVETTIGVDLLVVRVTYSDVAVILVSMASWVTLGSIFGLPISSTQSVVGAAVGLSLIESGLGSIDFGTLGVILVGWIVFPLLSLVGSFSLYRASVALLGKLAPGLRRRVKVLRASSVLLLFWVVLTSFSGGANNIAGATAFLRFTPDLDLTTLRPVTAVAMAVGLIVLGRRVLRTVGAGLVELNPVSALTVQVSVALTVLGGVLSRVPLSVTQVMVGAIVGLGLAGGVYVDYKKLETILFAWVLSFVVPAMVAVSSYLILLRL
jgi:PiT family inorganic phosphate transporter